jgi:hypothetical protein
VIIKKKLDEDSSRLWNKRKEVVQSMNVFDHNLYEYKKGLRNLAIYTTSLKYKDKIEERLRKEGLDYFMQHTNGGKINIFFGARECIELIKIMDLKSLSALTDEEDFMLGIMLGYDRLKQCQRYLKRRQQNQ